MLSGVKAFLFLFCLCTTMLSKSFRPAIIFASRKTKPCHPERSRSACDGEVEGPRRWWYSPCSFREFLRCTVPVTCPRTVHGNAFPGRKNRSTHSLAEHLVSAWTSTHPRGPSTP